MLRGCLAEDSVEDLPPTTSFLTRVWKVSSFHRPNSDLVIEI